VPVLVPDDAQYAAALGAAVLGRGRWLKRSRAAAA
jgi:hypothetical protein